MSINKKLVHFSNKDKFIEQLESDNILDSSIVFIKDSNEIFTHGTTYSYVNWSVLKTDVPAGYSTVYGPDNVQLLDSAGNELYILI